MKHDKEQLNKQYETLPDELKEALFSSDITKQIQEIGERHNMHVDKMGQLRDEVGLVMLGSTRHDQFAEVLSKALGMSTSAAAPIVKDVDKHIFSTIRESLKEITATPQRSRGQEPPSAFERKLNERVHTAPTTTDGEPTKTRPDAPDPYREPIE